MSGRYDPYPIIIDNSAGQHIISSDHYTIPLRVSKAGPPVFAPSRVTTSSGRESESPLAKLIVARENIISGWRALLHAE